MTSFLHFKKQGPRRTLGPDVRACHFTQWIDDTMSPLDEERWNMLRRREEEGRMAARNAERLRLHNEALKKELDDIRKGRNT